MANYGSYIFGWLVGYSGFLGPIAGVLICDYFVIRTENLGDARSVPARRPVRILARRQLASHRRSRGRRGSGVYWPASSLPLRVFYNYAWFVGFAVSFVAYFALTPKPAPVCRPQTETRK